MTKFPLLAGYYQRMIPVIDVMNGQVVRAIGGEREKYQPIVSQLTSSTDPHQVSQVLIQAAQASDLYIADLDAIRGDGRISSCIENLIEKVTCTCWVDCGLRESSDLAQLPRRVTLNPIVGFETARSPKLLEDIVKLNGTGPPAFSIDLREGELVGDWKSWGLAHSRDIDGLAEKALNTGVQNLIVIDLARVGRGEGSVTVEIIRKIRRIDRELKLLAGGGIRNRKDVEILIDAGVDAVLVASSLHDGGMKL